MKHRILNGSILLCLLIILSDLFCVDMALIKNGSEVFAFQGKLNDNKRLNFTFTRNGNTISGYRHYGKNKLEGKVDEFGTYLLNEFEDSVKKSLITFEMNKDSIFGTIENLIEDSSQKFSLKRFYSTGNPFISNESVDENKPFLVLSKGSDKIRIDLSNYIDIRRNYDFYKVFADSSSGYKTLLFFHGNSYPEKAVNERFQDKKREYYLIWIDLDEYLRPRKIESVLLQSDINKRIDNAIAGQINPFKGKIEFAIYDLKIKKKYFLKFDETEKEKGLQLSEQDGVINYEDTKIDTSYLNYNSFNSRLIVNSRLHRIYNDRPSYNFENIRIENTDPEIDYNDFLNDMTGFSKDNGWWWYPDKIKFEFTDYNFDTYPDLSFKDHRSGAQNVMRQVWLFDHVNKKFVYNDFLSSVSIWGIEPENQIIKTGWHNGYESYSITNFIFENGVYNEIYKERSEYDQITKIKSLSIKKKINGEWIETLEEFEK